VCLEVGSGVVEAVGVLGTATEADALDVTFALIFFCCSVTFACAGVDSFAFVGALNDFAGEEGTEEEELAIDCLEDEAVLCG